MLVLQALEIQRIFLGKCSKCLTEKATKFPFEVKKGLKVSKSDEISHKLPGAPGAPPNFNSHFQVFSGNL